MLRCERNRLVSRWQGCWLIAMWLLFPGLIQGQESPRRARASGSTLSGPDEPLKLARPTSNSTARSPATADPARPKSGTWTTSTASLVFVLAIIAGGAWFFRRQGCRVPGLLPDEVVQVLGRRYLDPRNSLQLIRCGSKILILCNSTQHGLTSLSEIADPLEVELITQQCLGDSSRSASDILAKSAAEPPHNYSAARERTGERPLDRSATPSGPTAPGGSRG